MLNSTEVLIIIYKIKEYFEKKYELNYITFFNNGYCFYFSLVLKELFPEGQIAEFNNHIYFIYKNFMIDFEKTDFKPDDIKILTEDELLVCMDQFTSRDKDEKALPIVEDLIGYGRKLLKNYN